MYLSSLVIFIPNILLTTGGHLEDVSHESTQYSKCEQVIGTTCFGKGVRKNIMDSILLTKVSIQCNHLVYLCAHILFCHQKYIYLFTCDRHHWAHTCTTHMTHQRWCLLIDWNFYDSESRLGMQHNS